MRSTKASGQDREDDVMPKNKPFAAEMKMINFARLFSKVLKEGTDYE
jgi:hypothetical protein